MKLFWSFAILVFVKSVMAGRQLKPNIIFIMTDDQDVELGSMRVMNQTRKIFSEGAEFVNAFVTSPICCPSRSSILTGMYTHNHNTLTNNMNCSSLNWRKGPERQSYARYLADAGYLTGHFGKYLNEYDGSYIPAGWHQWVGLVRNSRFYNYTLRHNNFLRRHKNNYGKDYFSDVITNHSLAFFRRAKSRNPNRPVLMVISHSAPHGPEDAAPQYQAAFENITAPRTPNWNYISLDKHWILRVTPKMDKQKIAFSDLLYRKRLQTLLSVDQSIQRVYDMLKETGTLDNTYIFMSSDHGYHLGQFGLVKGKSMPYESDIRVPFYARGPNIPRNVRIQQIVLNIDLAPTFLDIAGIKTPRTMDGVSVMKLFTRRHRKPNDQPRVRRKISHRWRDTFLISRGKPRRVNKQRATKKQTKSAKATFLERLCAESKYQSPCLAGQQWHCTKLKGRLRLKKCKRIEQLPVHPTKPSIEMCTCYRPRLPWVKPTKEQPSRDDENNYQEQQKRLLRSQQRRAHKQSKHYKEVYRAMKMAVRRQKAKMLNMKPIEEENDVEIEKRLERLNAKIAGIKFRLEALRGRKKKLIKIKEEKETENYLKQKYEEFPCPCPTPSQSAKSRRPRGDNKAGKLRRRLRSGAINPEVYKKRLQRRNKKKNSLKSSLRAGKKRKKIIKKKPRRTKCSVPGMSCFYQTNHHWKTPPLWKGGEFCFCPSSSNNTYWCLRTINQHQNFLYCEYITQFLEYFDLNTDPYELYNIVDRISPSVLYDLHHQLERLKACKGSHSCTQYHGKPHKKPVQSVNSTSKPVTKTRTTDQEPTTTTHSTKQSSYIETTKQPTELSTKTVTEGDGQLNKDKSKNGNKELLSEKEKIEKRKRRKQKKVGTSPTPTTNVKKAKKGKTKAEKKKRREKNRGQKKTRNDNKRDGFSTASP